MIQIPESPHQFAPEEIKRILGTTESGIRPKQAKELLRVFGKKNNAILTNGPAMATFNSCRGSSGNFSSLAKPPIGSRMMSRVWIPYRCAVSACPNSCRITQAKINRTKSRVHQVSTQGVPDRKLERMIHSNSNENVQ